MAMTQTQHFLLVLLVLLKGLFHQILSYQIFYPLHTHKQVSLSIPKTPVPSLAKFSWQRLSFGIFLFHIDFTPDIFNLREFHFLEILIFDDLIQFCQKIYNVLYGTFYGVELR